MSTIDEKRIKLTSLFMLLFCSVFILAGDALMVIKASGVKINYTGNLIYSLLAVMIPVVFFLIFRRQNKLDNIRHRKLRVSDVLIIILLYLFALPVGTFLNLLSQLFTTNVAVEGIGMMITEISFIPAMILTAVIPAIQEELMCRGIVYESYNKANPLAAVLISSLFFGMMHGNLNQMIYATFLGFVMALTVEATGSIYGSMVFHFLVNGSSTVLIYLQPVILKIARFFYATLLASGMELEAEMIRQAYGGSFEIEDYLKMAASAPKSIIGAMLIPNFVLAVCFGILAFFVYRWLARRNGQWDAVKAIFVRKRKQETGQEADDQLQTGMVAEPVRFRKLLSPLLIATFVIMLVDLIFDTLVRSGVIV